MWDRHGNLALNAPIKPLDQLLHAKILIQTLSDEITRAGSCIPKVLPRVIQWRNEIREVTLICAAAPSDSRSGNDVRSYRSRRTENAQLVYSLNLRRKTEERRRSIFVPDQHS